MANTPNSGNNAFASPKAAKPMDSNKGMVSKGINNKPKSTVKLGATSGLNYFPSPKAAKPSNSTKN